MDIGKRLKMLRKEQRETQEQVARAIDIVLRHYQRIELGEGLPGIEVFYALADHFQVNADYLLGRTDVREMLPPPSEEEAGHE
nr:helix-turn-helix transcriptional regulator [uncultured Oscillibacter sp.]